MGIDRKTGVWMSEVPGENCIPPDDAENEIMMARGESENRADAALDVPDSGEINPRETERPKTTAARIERYRDR